MKNSRAYFASVATLFILIAIDQFTKYLVQKSKLSFYCNQDLAFSISINSYIFIPIWIFIVALISIHIFREIKNNGRFGWPVFFPVLVLAGALSNFIDRIVHGCVIDFINLEFFPSFNLADMFISIGVCGIILLHIKEKKDHES
jgi:signal peptidase II